MKVVFIRHGKTMGNLEKRYIGRTDEPLCAEGAKEININIMRGAYPAAGRVYCSPMKRCMQTARLIYPDISPALCEDLRECDFGSFEGKNYRELAENADYQNWIDSGGTMDFPGGESGADFRRRCEAAYLKIISQLEREAESRGRDTHININAENICGRKEISDKSIKSGCKNINTKTESVCSEDTQSGTADAAFVVHGGVIMSVFSAFEQSGKGYFDWQVKNGCGFLCECRGNGGIKIIRHF